MRAEGPRAAGLGLPEAPRLGEARGPRPAAPSADDADDDDVVDDEPEAPDVYSLPPGADASLDWGLTAHLLPDGSPRIVERELRVPPELAGLRLDHFIKTQIARLSRTKIQDVIATQLTRDAPGRLKPATLVATGDRFVIRRAARREPACPRTFAVVHEDARVRVVDKPAFLPVHASAKFYFNTLTRVLGERYPGEAELQICHRLDRETSGCLVVARDRAAAAFVKDRIADKRVTTKVYVAIVHGAPPWDAEVSLDMPLRLSTIADPTRLPGLRMLSDTRGLPSLTRVRVLARTADKALVHCTLVTGRMHQIRVHLAHAGFPIVGDKLYAHGDDAFITYCDRGLIPELAARFILPRHALHAAAIAFPHPDGGSVHARAALPADMAALIGRSAADAAAW